MPRIYTSADVRDSRHIYLACFGTIDGPWRGDVGLTLIKPTAPGLE